MVPVFLLVMTLADKPSDVPVVFADRHHCMEAGKSFIEHSRKQDPDKQVGFNCKESVLLDVGVQGSSRDSDD